MAPPEPESWPSHIRFLKYARGEDGSSPLFFFWKTASERNNITRFIAIVAYKISRAIPASREPIETVVDADPMIIHQSVDVQLTKLINEPLRRLHSTGFDFKDSPFVVITDGLDKCKGKDAHV